MEAGVDRGENSDKEGEDNGLGNTTVSVKPWSNHKTHISSSGGFLINDNEEIESNEEIERNAQNFRSRPPIPAMSMSSAQEDVLDAEKYISELRRHERRNDEPEGDAGAQRSLLLFMIPVLVSFLKSV
jgi:hypothetical protein